MITAAQRFELTTRINKALQDEASTKETYASILRDVLDIMPLIPIESIDPTGEHTIAQQVAALKPKGKKVDRQEFLKRLEQAVLEGKKVTESPFQ